MDTTQIINFLKSSGTRDWLHMPPRMDKKSSRLSLESREEGNALFAQAYHDSSVHLKIWKHYSQSIAYAPSDSDDLALAYCNRASFLMHIGKLDDCTKDVERGLAVARSQMLRAMLIARKELCSRAKAEAGEASSSGDGHEDPRVQQIWAEKESANPFDAIAVLEKEAGGRCVVAKRDIKPGEIVFVAKPQFMCPNLRVAFAYCGHCMKVSWSAIPCQHCSWCMFCSEECRKEAWKEYHDVECSVVPYVVYDDRFDYHSQTALRMFISAVRQAGSIGKLRERVRTMADEPSRDLEEVIFRDQFKAVWSLAPGDMGRHVEKAIQATIMIAKSSSILGKSKVLFSEDDLFDDDFIFALLVIMKFMGICYMKGLVVRELPPRCWFMRSYKDCRETRCCERAFIVPRISCFINHSCFPNVTYCSNDDMSIALFSIQPIKKDSELTTSYGPYYFRSVVSERQVFFSGLNFTCKCIACEEKWPPIYQFFLENRRKELQEIPSAEDYANDYRYFTAYRDLIRKSENTRYDLDRVNRISQAVEEVISQVNQPSFVTILLFSNLMTTFHTVFNYKLIVPSNCNT